MRNLTSIESTNSILAEVQFELMATDQSTTWIFTQDDLVAPLPSINWKIDFGGTLGDTSNYDITISTSLGFIKENLSNFTSGQTKLKVTVNSDQYQPHRGRVKTFQRDALDLNKIQFTVYDKFLDENPTFPPVSLQDSYSTLHPDVLNADWGIPFYYGKHNRPFYHVPVECDIATLLAAQNITSENHVNSIWYTNNITNILSNSNLFLSSKIWSDNGFITTNSTNVFSENALSANFVIHDVGDEYSKLIEFFGEPATYTITGVQCYNISSYSSIHSKSNILSIENAIVEKYVANVQSHATLGNYIDYHPMKLKENLDIRGIHHVDFEFDLRGVNSTDFNDFTLSFVNFPKENFPKQPHADMIFRTIGFGVGNTSSYSEIGSNTLSSPVTINGMFNEKLYDTYLRTDLLVESVSNAGHLLTNQQYGVSLELESSNYTNYSIFSFPVNSNDVAISENPIQIIENMLDQTSFGFVQSQTSESQTLTTSYKFQCYFGERAPVQDILSEFGEITKTYMWIGDSGSLNMRNYQNSDSVNIDLTIGLNDIILGKFNILENPLGTSRYKSIKADNITVNYNYDFQKNQYLNSVNTYKANNSFCNSANASGIRRDIIKQTKYILDTDTASFYSDTLVRKSTQSETFINMKLPAKFFDLEVTDVLKIQHPMIVGSESLYQIIELTQDLQNAEVSIVAQELIDL